MNEEYSEEYRQSIFEYEKKTKLLRIGYVPGVIRHYYHGSKKNRNYGNRWKVLVDHNYIPNKHFTKDENGLLVPTDDCPPQLLSEIFNYFKSRNDDEMYEGGDFSKRIKSFSNISNVINNSNVNETQDNTAFISTLFSAFDTFINSPDDQL
jgi:hypothetical protein